MLISNLDTYFLEVSVHVLLKVAAKSSFRGKKIWKFSILGYFSKAKAEEYGQKDWRVCNRFGIIITCSGTDFLEFGARVSLKVATKDGCNEQGQQISKLKW